MNVNIAQLITLNTYGNDFLINNRTTSELWKKKCFSGIGFIQFFENNKIEIATDPNEWLTFLKREGCKSLGLNFQYTENNSNRADHFSAGLIGGGGTWMIESRYSDHLRYWSVTWQYHHDMELYDRRCLDLIYRRQFKKHELKIKETYEVEFSKKQLGQALWNISEFASNQGYEKWADFFSLAMDNLYGSDPQNDCYFNDILPSDRYSLSEKQLIFSISKAWCFGTQGSWNDINFKDKLSTERYLKFSTELYDAMIKGILAITNKY